VADNFFLVQVVCGQIPLSPLSHRHTGGTSKLLQAVLFLAGHTLFLPLSEPWRQKQQACHLAEWQPLVLTVKHHMKWLKALLRQCWDKIFFTL